MPDEKRGRHPDQDPSGGVKRGRPPDEGPADETRRRRPSDEGRAESARRRSAPPRLRPAELARQARDELSEITGLEPIGVSGLEPYDDGTWTVVVELLELARIPEAHDVLGSYEVELDENGHLRRYQRLRRYVRGDKDQQETLGGLK